MQNGAVDDSKASSLSSRTPIAKWKNGVMDKEQDFNPESVKFEMR